MPTANCCCGNLVVETDGEPVVNAVCSCANCKRRTGSAFGWSVYFADPHFRVVAGEPVRWARDSVTGPQERFFCAVCGTTLFWRSAPFPGHTGVAGGCFAPRDVGEPNFAAYDAGRCGWLSLPETWLRTA